MKNSYRGMLIQIIVKHVFNKTKLTDLDEIKDTIQKKLNSELKFKTIVSDITIKDKEHFFGFVTFMDDNDEIRILDFILEHN